MTKDDRKPTIFIIGGIGPWASASVHEKILKKYSSVDAKNDSYPKIIHISANIPDFIDSSMDDAKKSLTILEQKLADFRDMSFDIGIIACNTMHIFFDEINEMFGQKLTNIVELAKKQINDGDKVGVLGTPFTLKNDIYQDERYSIFYPENINAPKRIIDRLIASKNHESTELLVDELKKMHNMGADKVVLGCTELSILNGDELKNRLARENMPANFIVDPIQAFLEQNL